MYNRVLIIFKLIEKIRRTKIYFEIYNFMDQTISKN